METAVEYVFRFVMYVSFGFTLEIVVSVSGIDRIAGMRLERRVPKKYLEGFVSLYMIPVHGFGLLLFFEPVRDLTRDLNILLRFALWALLITFMEAAWGFLYDRLFGFYSWDYYADSKFRVFKRGYTLWTLVPCWGFAGLAMEIYTDLMIHLSPHVAGFFLG